MSLGPMTTMDFLPVLPHAFQLQQPPPSHPKSTTLVRPPRYLILPRRRPSSPSVVAVSALNRPKGFGSRTHSTKSRTTASKKKEKKKKGSRGYDGEEEEDVEEKEREREVAIPEIVTNRMMRRIGVSVGVPLTLGLLFFPFFYYLKVVAKVDVPSWVPLIVSFFFFGTALLGISYGIVSSSWEPLREGSLLGWNEAQRNWPVFWDSLWGRRSSTSKRR